MGAERHRARVSGGPFGIGNNAFVALPFIERPDAHFTVTAWVQPEDLSVFNVIFSWGGEDTGAAPFTSLGIDTAGNVQFGERKNVNVAGAQSVIGTTVLEACAWTHVAVTRNGSAVRVYVNGVLDGTSDAITYNLDPTGLFNFTSIGTLRRDETFSPVSSQRAFFFNGQIDEVQLWDIALDQATIQGLVANEVDSMHPNYANLIGYWKMNDGMGQMVTDSAGVNHGTLGDSVTVTIDDPTWAAPVVNSCPSNTPPTADAGGPYLVAVSNAVNFNGSGSSDPDSDPLTETWTADGGTVDDFNYTAGLVPGVYDVQLTVDDGEFSSDPATTMVVVYDPNGAFVTGGGWFTSPVDAYIANPGLTGKAEFGFVSKYKKGATVPTGNTHFQFKTADLEFKSSEYEWLVVAGPQAQYKGSGTINDAGDFGFMLTAKDSAINGTPATDTFRIKIWDKNSGAPDPTVYDNGTNQPIDQGSIKIHK